MPWKARRHARLASASCPISMMRPRRSAAARRRAPTARRPPGAELRLLEEVCAKKSQEERLRRARSISPTTPSQVDAPRRPPRSIRRGMYLPPRPRRSGGLDRRGRQRLAHHGHVAHGGAPRLGARARRARRRGSGAPRPPPAVDARRHLLRRGSPCRVSCAFCAAATVTQRPRRSTDSRTARCSRNRRIDFTLRVCAPRGIQSPARRAPRGAEHGAGEHGARRPLIGNAVVDRTKVEAASSG